jgi:hypothetical protein
MKYFAEIENNLVKNVIIVEDLDFINLIKQETGNEFLEFVMEDEDDLNVARIGEYVLDGNFYSSQQAYDDKVLTEEEILALGMEAPVKPVETIPVAVL